MKKVETLKLPKGVDQLFLDEINSQSTDQLKATIVRLQVQNQENEAFKESEDYLHAEEDYQMARDSWMLVAGPVKDVTVAIKNKTKLVVERLKEKGQA